MENYLDFSLMNCAKLDRASKGVWDGCLVSGRRLSIGPFGRMTCKDPDWKS